MNDVGHRRLRTGMAGATPFVALWLSGKLGPPPRTGLMSTAWCVLTAASLLGMLLVCPDT